jgi:hypothetical protein
LTLLGVANPCTSKNASTSDDAPKNTVRPCCSKQEGEWSCQLDGQLVKHHRGGTWSCGGVHRSNASPRGCGCLCDRIKCDIHQMRTCSNMTSSNRMNAVWRGWWMTATTVRLRRANDLDQRRGTPPPLNTIHHRRYTGTTPIISPHTSPSEHTRATSVIQ